MASTPSSAETSHRIRSTTAFVVETLVLLGVLIASIGVFTQLLARSTSTADQSERLCQAVGVAEDAAEEFTAAPAAVEAGETVGKGVAAKGRDGFSVRCKVSETERGAGTFYSAHIVVSDSEGTVYKLDTSRYVSEVE